MPPDTPTPGSPEDWLRHARSDLALAQQRSAPEILLAMLCFHTQQAAEKGIKAALVQQGLVFPYTHDLARLITLVAVRQQGQTTDARHGVLLGDLLRRWPHCFWSLSYRDSARRQRR